MSFSSIFVQVAVRLENCLLVPWLQSMEYTQTAWRLVGGAGTKEAAGALALLALLKEGKSAFLSHGLLERLASGNFVFKYSPTIRVS